MSPHQQQVLEALHGVCVGLCFARLTSGALRPSATPHLFRPSPPFPTRLTKTLASHLGPPASLTQRPGVKNAKGTPSRPGPQLPPTRGLAVVIGDGRLWRLTWVAMG